MRLTKIRDADGIRMLNGRRRLRLTLKPRDRLAFLKVVARKYVLPDGLYRQLFCREFIVACKIDLPHSSAAKTPLEHVPLREQLRPRQRGFVAVSSCGHAATSSG